MTINIVQDSGSQMVVILPPKEHLAMSEIFLANRMGEERMLLASSELRLELLLNKHLAMHRTALSDNELSDLIVARLRIHDLGCSGLS